MSAICWSVAVDTDLQIGCDLHCLITCLLRRSRFILNQVSQPRKSRAIQANALEDLKSTTDDALPNFLNSLKFQQSHLLADVRLLLGYTAVTLGAATFYADYKLGWVETKAYTLWAVVAYFTLNSALTIWIWAIEKGCIYNGSRGLVTVSPVG